MCKRRKIHNVWTARSEARSRNRSKKAAGESAAPSDGAAIILLRRRRGCFRKPGRHQDRPYDDESSGGDIRPADGGFEHAGCRRRPGDQRACLVLLGQPGGGDPGEGSIRQSPGIGRPLRTGQRSHCVCHQAECRTGRDKAEHCITEAEKGKKFKLLAESSGKKLWVSWSSSNPRVATVDKTGKIKAKRPGKATITASAGGKRAVCKVRVTKSSGNKVTRNFRLLSDGSTAFRIQMNTSYLQIQKGRKYRFYACRTAGNQKKVRASFKSSNPKVVSVSRWGGMIKAKKKGSAYITATFQNMTCRCRVIVKKKTNLVETVNFRMVAGGKAGKLQTSAFRIRTGRGQSFSLRAAVDTTLLGAWQVRWASSDPSVATVGGDGVIHTVGTGSCVITAAWNGLKASTSVTVDQKVARMTDVAERFGVDGAGRYRAGGGGTSYRRYPTVLLAGASTLDYWDTAKDAFPGCRVVNTAVSGTNLQYLQDRLSQNVLSYHPDAVVLFHGQNDIRNQTTPDLGMGKDVGQRVAAQLESIHQGLPGTPVWYVSLLHVPKKKDAGPEIDEANRIIKDYCDRTPDVYWIDLSPYFWNRQNGQYALTLFKDSIHPNRSGYEVWKNIVGIPVSNALYSWT